MLSAPQFEMLRNLTPAPNFSLQNHQNQACSLAELRGNAPLVLLFFRGAFCATARRDLLSYSDICGRIEGLNARLVAVSVDSPDELMRLRETLELQFPLLSDADFSVSRQYGVYLSDETDAGPQPHGEPAVFVLDGQGRLVFSQIQSGPKGAASANETLLMLLYMAQNGGNYW